MITESADWGETIISQGGIEECLVDARKTEKGEQPDADSGENSEADTDQASSDDDGDDASKHDEAPVAALPEVQKGFSKLKPGEYMIPTVWRIAHGKPEAVLISLDPDVRIFVRKFSDGGFDDCLGVDQEDLKPKAFKKPEKKKRFKAWSETRPDAE